MQIIPNEAKTAWSTSRTLAFATSLLLLTGCASNSAAHIDPKDPYEGFNRKVFKFNMTLDRSIFRPVAKAYKTVVPSPIALGINNAYENFGEINTIANDILQGNLYYTLNDTWRFAINSTLGIFGLFDVASHIGLAKHTQDFGITLAHWGIAPESAYLMLPFFGPSTIRDTISMPVDYNYLSAWTHIQPKRDRTNLYLFRALVKRTALLPADKLIDRSFDPYIFVRNAYLQRRAHLVEQSHAKHHTSKRKVKQAKKASLKKTTSTKH